jgi:hypothetical protein
MSSNTNRSDCESYSSIDKHNLYNKHFDKQNSNVINLNKNPSKTIDKICKIPTDEITTRGNDSTPDVLKSYFIVRL